MIEVGAYLGDVSFTDHNGNVEHLTGSRSKVIFCYPRANTPG